MSSVNDRVGRENFNGVIEVHEEKVREHLGELVRASVPPACSLAFCGGGENPPNVGGKEWNVRAIISTWISNPMRIGAQSFPDFRRNSTASPVTTQ